jgi:drug/metabolite transporter (DMT)-like permease
MKKTRRANLLLFLAAFIWGTSFVAQSAGMEHIGPFTFNAIRYAIGVLVLLPLIIRRKSRLDRKFFLVSLRIGLILFAASSLQQVALQTAGAGKAGFITSLYIVLVPLISSFFGKKVSFHHWLAVAASLLGLYLMTYAASGALVPADFLLFIGAVGFSFHIITVDRKAGDLDPLALSAAQFVIASLLSIPAALIFEYQRPLALVAPALPSLLYTGIFSCGVAYTLQLVGQKDSDGAVASLILGLEAVFAVIGGALILHERLSAKELWGSGLMLLAVFYVTFFESRNKLPA